MLDEFKEPMFPEEKDYTRPTFDRKAGELGIFVDVFDAVPMYNNVFGSRQFFLMSLVDRFYNEVHRGELFKIKGFFHKRNLLTDITIEYFHPGLLLIVSTNSKLGLDNLVKTYESGKLNKAFVECFSTEKVQKKMEVTNLQLKIKIFQDEINSVAMEWELKYLPQPYLISTSEKDIRMINIIKKYQQKILFKTLNKLKDDETQFENNSSEFLQYLKQHSPPNQEEIRNLFDANKLYKVFADDIYAQIRLNLFQNYFKIIEDLQKSIRDTEMHVSFPLSQIKVGCENEGQMRVNVQIQEKISALKIMLREKSLFKAFSSTVETFIPNHDRKIWGGMLCLIPTSVSILTDIDQQIDNYFQLGNFNYILRKYQKEHKK